MEGGSGNFSWISSNQTVATVTIKGAVSGGLARGHCTVQARDAQNPFHYAEIQESLSFIIFFWAVYCSEMPSCPGLETESFCLKVKVCLLFRRAGLGFLEAFIAAFCQWDCFQFTLLDFHLSISYILSVRCFFMQYYLAAEFTLYPV